MSNCARSRRLEGKDLEEWKRLLRSFLKRVNVTVREFANQMGVSRQAVYYWLKSSKVDWTVFLATLLALDTLLCKAGGYEVCPELCDEITIFYRNILDQDQRREGLTNNDHQRKDGKIQGVEGLGYS